MLPFEQIPKGKPSYLMQIILLTHERELTRQTNTGQLALNLLPDFCQRIIWSRVNPDRQLIDLLSKGNAKLLFPREDVEETNAAKSIPQIKEELIDLPSVVIILDATWQEARKMLRQSPYLKAAARVTLPHSEPSRYTMRRNQLPEGLCTVECIIALLKQAQMLNEAEKLESKFIEHCQTVR